MAYSCLKNAKAYDPTQKWNGSMQEIWLEDDRICAEPNADDQAKATYYDLTGAVVMASAIDIHSHIAGGNVNTARLLLPDQHRNHLQRQKVHPFQCAKWSSFDTGYRYAEMGYGLVIEPAMLPVNAPQVHAELADIPMIDTGSVDHWDIS